MKTPREILFERHRHAEPRLDAIRRAALAALPTAQSAEAPQPGRSERALVRGMLGKVWAELIWPSRRAWAGLAALWLAVLAANLEMNAASGAVPAARSASNREVAQSIEEQRRLLAELLATANLAPIEAPRPGARPRSERPVSCKAC